jgi:serine/threonine-protein kinase
VEALATVTSGLKIGPYVVEAPLGRGSTAIVYRAVHAFLEKRVALKVMPEEEQPQILERFLDEARLLARLSHPGLVHIYDCGILPQGGAFLAMELLEGELLHDRMRRRGRLALDEMVDIVRQLTDALEVVHDAGLIHRDIKPTNIFLVGDRVKLLDFGVAKQLDARPRTLPGQLLGTPYYMSPEQCRGDAHMDRRSDVYALGALVFQMATGRPPFDMATLPEVIEAHLLFAPPPLASLAPELPPAVGAVVARALAKAPDDRFSCALAMANAFEEAAGRRGKSTAPMMPAFDPRMTVPHKAQAAPLPVPMPTEIVPHLHLRRRMLLAVLATVAVTCALIFVVALLAAPEPPAQMALEPPPKPAVAPPEPERVIEVIRDDEARPRPHKRHPPPSVTRDQETSAEVVIPSPRAIPELRDPFHDQ